MTTLSEYQVARKHLRRMIAELDALRKIADETAEQMDALAARIEGQRLVIGMMNIDRSVHVPAPVRFGAIEEVAA